MRVLKDLSEASSMAEITEELQLLNKDLRVIRDVYAKAAELDPDYAKLYEATQKAYHYMRLKAHY